MTSRGGAVLGVGPIGVLGLVGVGGVVVAGVAVALRDVVAHRGVAVAFHCGVGGVVLAHHELGDRGRRARVNGRATAGLRRECSIRIDGFHHAKSGGTIYTVGFGGVGGSILAFCMVK